MKHKYEVVDSGFNREHYSDLIGKIYDGNPPSYAQVKIVDEKKSLRDIWSLQSKTFQEENTTDMIEDFVIKALRAGYEKNEIVEGIREFYRQAPEVGNNIFNRTIIKMKGLGRNVNELLSSGSNWYKKAQKQ